ncbi:MAG: ECF transporter S component [Clostridia bacterium]|nr:ECF transporter S component [Clostridia bacterium]
MQKKSLAVTVACFLLIILMLLVTWKFKLNYFFSSSVIIILSLTPFFFSFENRRPDARELVIIAVMTALAVVSRVAFIALPTIKPVIAVIMLAGFAFGPQVGFLTGALTAFVSNFIFSQGPWTPWQMLAWGIAGLIAGAFSRAKIVTGENRITSAILGFVTVIGITGPILDIGSTFMMSTTITLKRIAMFLGTGFAVNLPLAISTAVTLFLITGSMMRKLERVQIKYGIFQEGGKTQ